MAAELTVFGKRSLPFKPSIFSDCAEHKTVYTIFQSRNVIEDISVNPKATNDINILVRNLVDEISNITYKDGYLKDSQKIVAEAKQVATKFKKGQICVAIQADLNLTYLRSVHDKISEYVTNQLTNDEPGPFARQTRRDLIVCNLNYLRDNIINKMIVSEMLVKIGNVVKNCRQIAALFSDDIDIDIQTYFNKIDEMLSFYDDEFNSFLVSVQDGLTNLYEEHFENYMNMANDALKTKIGLCDFAPKSLMKGANSSRCVCLAFLLNGFWVGVFLVLFAFLPIIFLGYLWACCMRKSAKIKHTPDSRNTNQEPRSGYGCSLNCRDESCICPHIPISASTPCNCAYDGCERASYSRNQLT